MAELLSLVLNHAQRRIAFDRLSTRVSGAYTVGVQADRPLDGWDPRWGSVDANGELLTFVDPITKTLMLKPAPMLSAYRSTTSGIYTRLAKSDFTLANASKWANHTRYGISGDYWLHGVGLTNEGGVSTTSYAQNRGFYVSMLVYDAALDRTRVEVGWNSSPSGAAGVSLRLFSDGDIEIWKDGIRRASGNVGAKDSGSQAASGRDVGFYLIPCRKRELLVLSTLGGGLSFPFEEIGEDAVDPAITAATNFWFYIPGTNRTATLQISPLQYPATAYRAAIPTRFLEAPGAGEVAEVDAYWSGPGTGSQSVDGSFVQEDDATALFVPDGSLRDCRLRVDLTGDGTTTPFVYGGKGGYPPISNLTNDSEEFDFTVYVLRCTLNVPESPSGVSMSIEARSPDEIDPDQASQFLRVGNRPIKASIGSTMILDGVAESAPRWSEGISDEVRRVEIEVRDRWKLLENHRFSDETPLDGMTLKAAFEWVATSAGLDIGELDIEDTGYVLPIIDGAGSRNDWIVKIRVGDTAASWIERLHNDFAATWFLGFVPTTSGIVLRFRSPEDLGDVPVATIYETSDEAIAAGYDTPETYKHVFRSYSERTLEPEANDVWVATVDHRTMLPISAHKADYDSQDPTLAPSLQPENWLGERRKYVWRDDALGTVEAAQAACELLFDRLTPVRVLAEWESEAILTIDGIPAWRGDVVTLEGRGDFRIVTLSIDFQLEYEDGAGVVWTWRNTRYVGELIQDVGSKGCGHSLPGTSLEEMRAAHELRLLSKAAGPEKDAEWALRPAIISIEL